MNTVILYNGESEDRYHQIQQLLTGATGREYRVFEASAAAAGEGCADGAACDVVLVDDWQGSQAGLERVRRCHAAYPSVPILFLTDHPGEEVIREARRAGALVCLPAADLTPAFLKWVIEHIIEQSQAEAARQSAVNRDAFRVRLADALRPLTGAVEIKRVASRLLAEALGANRAAFIEIDLTGQTFLVEGDYAAAGLGSLAGQRPYQNPPAPILEMMRSGQTLAVEDRAQIALESEQEQGIFGAIGCGSFVLAPLVREGRMAACMAAGLPAPHAWSDNEIALAQETAERTWAAVVRAQAEAALRESEERMRALVEPFAQAVWETDAAGQVVKDSPSWRAYTGQNLEEWLGDGWVNAFHPDDRSQALRTWQEAARTGKPLNAEYRLQSADGGYRWTNVRAAPLRGPGGEILKWVGMNIDITEQKQAEEVVHQVNADLSAERNRLATVLEALPIGVAILDEAGGIASKNKGYEALWGYPIPETASVEDYQAFKAWWAETGEPVQPEERASAVSLRTGETVINQFLLIERFDGQRSYVLNSAAPMFGVDGRVEGCVVAIRDITRVAEVENELRESQNRFRIALQGVPIMVYTCDRELRYTWIYQPLRGFTEEGVLGKRDDELIPPEAAAELTAVKQKALDSGLGGMQEVRVVLNGVETDYILTTEPMRDRQGNVTGLTCAAIDISEQKRLEAEQREAVIHIEVQRRLMDQRERERSSFARDIHDGPIQTLSAALFMLQTLRADFPDAEDQQEIAQLSEDIKKSIQELRDLMNDLRPPALLHFGLSQVIRYMTEDYRARHPNIKFELDLGDDERDTLSEDLRLSLFRIYQAAISNIIRHSGASRVWVHFGIEEDTYHLELRDNGTGFVVSEDFDRLSSEGHFGLVGMKERADAIGARLEVSSQPAGGTVILVTGRLDR